MSKITHQEMLTFANDQYAKSIKSEEQEWVRFYNYIEQNQKRDELLELLLNGCPKGMSLDDYKEIIETLKGELK